jgi:tetratricopeptide (TPR) repeat protein
MTKIANLLACLLVLPLAACTSYSFGHRDTNCDPDQRLDALLDQWEQGKDPNSGRIVVDNDRIRYDIERLSLEFPAHVRTQMACAVLAYEAKEPEKAQNYLDRVLKDQPGHPEAGILRSRIAIDEGNLQLAKRVLETQVQYRPDNAGLREALSGVLYMSKDLEGAKAAIAAAERLGAPAWRVAFHRGLIAEASGDVAEARRQYQAAAESNPEYQPAKARLSGMNAAGG